MPIPIFFPDQEDREEDETLNIGFILGDPRFDGSEWDDEEIGDCPGLYD